MTGLQAVCESTEGQSWQYSIYYLLSPKVNLDLPFEKPASKQIGTKPVLENEYPWMSAPEKM